MTGFYGFWKTVIDAQGRFATDCVPKMNSKDFLKPGDKLTYKGVTWHWHKDIIANAEKLLVKETVYTLKSIQVISSWCCVTLVETGDVEYSLGFFTY